MIEDASPEETIPELVARMRTRDLRRTLDDLESMLGLEKAHTDEELGQFAMMAIHSIFLACAFIDDSKVRDAVIALCDAIHQRSGDFWAATLQAEALNRRVDGLLKKSLTAREAEAKAVSLASNVKRPKNKVIALEVGRSEPWVSAILKKHKL